MEKFKRKADNVEFSTLPANIFYLFYLLKLFLCQPFAPLTAHHAVNAKNHEGNAEQLTHIEEHAVLEGFLILLGVLDENAAGEDKEEAKAEVEA